MALFLRRCGLSSIVLVTFAVLTRSVLAEDTSGFQQFGGQPISESSYRYFTAITTRTGSFRCSGVLIGRRFIATAAHCVTGSVDTTFVDVGYFCVRRDNCGRPHEVIAIDSVATIPGDRGDFAILTLEKAPSTRPKIRPIIPDIGGKILKKLDPNARMKLVGGGRPAEGLGPSEFVEELTVRYIPLKQCKNSGLTRDLFGIICSEPEGGSRAGPCEGDSGGPVIVKRKGVEYLVAVHSFGKRQCGSERVKPDGHATVKKATKLIRSVICNGAYPEDWCEEKKKKKKKKDEPVQEPAEKPTMQEPTEEDRGKPKTKGPTNDVDFESSTEEPTLEPTTEPTLEPTPDFISEPTADEDDVGVVSISYALQWVAVISSCSVTSQDRLTLRCTGSGATITYMGFQAVDTEQVQCTPNGQSALSCVGSDVTDSSFGALVLFRCTAGPARLAAQVTSGATTAVCPGTVLQVEQSFSEALRLAALCNSEFEFGGMECPDEATVAPLLNDVGFSCLSTEKCATTTSSCSLTVSATVTRYNAPPSRCFT